MQIESFVDTLGRVREGWAEPAGVEANQYSKDPSRKHGRAGGRLAYFTLERSVGSDAYHIYRG